MESKISELFLLSESENFNRISDFENDSLEFACLQLEYFFSKQLPFSFHFIVYETFCFFALTKPFISKKNEAKMLVNILLKRFAFTLLASSVK